VKLRTLRPLLLGLMVTIAFPLPVMAKRICFSDAFNVYALDVQGTCKRQKPGSHKTKTAALRGFTTGNCANGALTGMCAGTDSGVYIQLLAHPSPGNGCVKFLLYVSGTSLADLAGAFDNVPFGADDGAIALTQIGCP